MFPDLDLSKLPSVSLSQKNSLPECSAIYFAVDSKNRVLYVGKATNLLARWKNHHRQEQLSRINRRNKIKIAWLSCSNQLDVLTNTEAYFINFYQPLLNRTLVPLKTITPSEIVLQTTLRKLSALDVVVFGFEPTMNSNPPTVYLKYPVEIWKGNNFVNNTGPVNKIIQANNKRKSTRLRWHQYEIKKLSLSKVRSWKTSCNGVHIDLSPWKSERGYFFGLKSEENLVIKTVAGVEMPTLNELELTKILEKYCFIRENYPGVCVLEHDPIPLLWSKH
ncbi:GIY-YIG nuclease family protein [Chroococcidiopsis sp. CCMEE 29]|uniref:GIY-YIG nuclease family protein n=1 Tax=Chroococcidiopsis sp. CCMEE 29 TaxID=155894 RepID=UPI002020DA61|nr:GIY-YIG nuclease family protein [Chroococcidiopsis sp. CCMEE 29]